MDQDYTCMHCGGELCSMCEGCTGECAECHCEKEDEGGEDEE